MKFQKKGWTGIWYKTEAPKLAVGWDALVFEIPFVYSTPAPYQTFPGKVFVKEVIKFPNFEFEANAISFLDDNLLGKNYYSNKELSDALNDLAKQELADLSKKFGNMLKNLWTRLGSNTKKLKPNCSDISSETSLK